ncbi:MAG: DUF4188 domain-containing protein [Bauldia sp.]|nr:DUF4188 domain-containing protein [Bauldia sp.]MCW5719224.1 DUF4188 domain-containing protein [Bauldia sp.]
MQTSESSRERDLISAGGGHVIPERVTAVIDGDFVVYLIGMRLNRPWKIRSWLPAFMAMRPMLREAVADTDSGLLGFQYLGRLTFVQYWRSYDHLWGYAHKAGGLHREAWSRFNRNISGNRGDIGIWHETYRIPAGAHESIYSGMPPFGLGRAGRLVRARSYERPRPPDPPHSAIGHGQPDPGV